MARHSRPTPSLAALVRLAPVAAVAVAGSALVGAASGLLIPAAVATAVDEVLAGSGPGGGLVLLAVLLTASAIAEAGSQLAGTWSSTEIAANLRRRFLRHVFALGLPSLRQHDQGDLVGRLTGNVTTTAESVPQLAQTVVGLITALGGLVALALLDWWLVVVYLVAVVPGVLLIRALLSRVNAHFGEYLERLSEIATRLADAVSGSRTIRACGTTRHEIDRVLSPLPGLAAAGHRTWQVQRAMSWQVQVVLAVVQAGVLAAAVLGLARGRLSPGELVAAGLYLNLALRLVDQLDTIMTIGLSQVTAKRVFDVLAERPVVGLRLAGQDRVDRLPPGPGAVSLRRVTVRHGDRLVLDRVDLDLPPGLAITLVGRSGAGKTTLAQLVGGLIAPDSGRVELDGVLVVALDQDVLHREVAYAFDRPVLLGRTLRDALTYGSEGVPQPWVDWAVNAARAGEFIQRLPAGLDTPVADAPFSGGEVQRLGLARALARGSRVVVLDDATSSLDTVTEAEIARTLTVDLAGRTRLVVGHRASTADRADLVVWLDQGRVRAMAPHRSLWSDPDYRAVFAAEADDDDLAA